MNEIDTRVACPCTLIEQDETCPVGFPSLICGVCDGIGLAPREKVDALAAEMLRIASDLGEPEDPFAAWESVAAITEERDALAAERDRLREQRDEARKIADHDKALWLKAEAALAEAWAARQAADHALVDRYRNPKTGCFVFPDDVAAIITALDKARAETGAVIEEIARRADKAADGYSEHGNHHAALALHLDAAGVRSLTPADATAALADRDKATRVACAALVERWRDMIREAELFERFLDRLPDIIREGQP